MSLSDLEKKLYDSDSGIENRKHESNQFDPLFSSAANVDSLKKEKPWEKTEDTGKPERKKIYKIGAIALGSIVLISAIIVGVVEFKQLAFNEKNVSIKIEGPADVGGTDRPTYKIIFKNDNRADLSNVQILLNYSENFKPEESQRLKIDNLSNSRIVLGTVKGHSAGEIEINGNFFAARDTVVYLNATFEYTPSGYSIKFQSKNQLGVNVKSSPLSMNVEAPLEAADGSKVDYVINFRNSSADYFDGVRLKVEYPDGFSFISSDISPSEGDNVWYLGSIKPDQEGKIVITGNIQGSGDEAKIIKTYLGYAKENGGFIVYDQKEKSTKLTSTMLSVSQSIDRKSDLNVNPGESLRYVISYRNNGNIAVKDAIVTEEMDSKILDFSKIDLIKGSYDASKKMITWRASDISGLSNLAPGEGGEIAFTVPVLERIPVENINDKNLSIVSTAKIDSPSVPSPIGSNKMIASNTMNLKLNSRIVLDVKGYYKDNQIENSGPTPPKVGQETSYTIHWKIINVSNSISDVKVTSSLPSGVKWIGKFLPENESIIFDDRTNQIEWNVGSLENGAGIISPAKEISFQISITPQINQIDKEVLLLNPSILTAKDSFTGVEAKVEVGQKDNKLPEDSSVEIKYKVTQ